jgi:hypothetical protein
MEYKQTLNKIKALLHIEVKLMENKLDSGAMVMAEAWEVGYPVFVVSDDGTQIPLPEGSYTLEDGNEFSVDAEGVITSFGASEAPVEEEQEMEAEAPAKKVVESQTKETHFSEEEKVEEKVEVAFNDDQKQELSKMIQNELKAFFEGEGFASFVKNAPVVDNTELSKVEVEAEEVKPIKHSPEKKPVQKKVLYSQKRKLSTRDRVRQKLFN